MKKNNCLAAKNMKAYFLKSERLGFRQWQPNDFDLALALWGDPEVTMLIDARGKLSEDQVREKLARELRTERECGVQYWPIFLLKGGEFVGCCGLRPYDLPRQIYEIGVHIRSRHWRQGYAFEAMQAALGYTFEHLKVKSLFAGHNPNNKASRQLLTKLGFRYTHDEHYPPTGLDHPSYLLSAAEWAAAHP